MKTNTFLKSTLLLFASIIFCIQVSAQNQSMMLPFSGINSVNQYEGCKVINFSNPSNSIISELPKHTFYAFGVQGRPHVEADLQNSNISMNEKYLGQHPMFAQNVVHDKDGNLLFFIVDNNIYNKNGEAFLKLDENGYAYSNDMYSYLLDGVVDPSANLFPSVIGDLFDGSTMNRFSVEVNHVALDPEIIVFPIKNECYKYGLIYSFFKSNATGNSTEIFYRTLKYIDEDKIILSDPIALSNYFSVPTGCFNESNRNLAISEYREDYNNYLLFVRFFDGFNIFPINDAGVIDFANMKDYIILSPEDGYDDDLNTFQYSSEMEVIKSNDDDYYYVAMGTCLGAINSSDAEVDFIKLNYVNLTVQSKWNKHLPKNGATTDPYFKELVKGLEFSPDGNYLYVTYKGQEELYYFNVNSGEYSNLSYVSNPSDFQYSEIELGRDNNLYYLYSNDGETVGGVSRLKYPDNPNPSNWEADLFSEEINNLYFSHDYLLGGTYNGDSKTLLFADQIDGSDYAAYYETIDNQCCIDHIYYSTWPSLSVFNQNPSTWTWSPGTENNPFHDNNGVIQINEDVEIPSGKEIIIKNLKFKFNNNKKVIVKPGAKLVLDNSVFTSVDDCEQSVFWQGIEVQGDPSKSQYPKSNQGYVEVINGGIIENALIGINAPAHKYVIDPVTTGIGGGGIIFARGATFKNCKVDVNIETYTNFNPNNTSQQIPNACYFANCIFKTDGLLNDPSVKPEAFVTLCGVQGVNFFANTFQNLDPQNYMVTERGIGIKSMDAGFTVNHLCTYSTVPCSNYQQNTFEGLYYGIYSQNINSLNRISVNDSKFLNNNRGIYLSGIYNYSVTSNTFDVGATEVVTTLSTTFTGGTVPLYETYKGYGLYLENTTTFDVQENEFYSTHNGAYGSLVWKSGTTIKELYNNTYHDLVVGTLASGDNSGLQIKCNKFINDISYTDIGITSGAIALNQGSCGSITSPAGNIFSHPCIGDFDDIMANSGVTQFIYNYHSYDATMPQCYTPIIVTPYDCGYAYSSSACPSKLNTGNTQTQLLAVIDNSNTQLITLNAMFDGGSTQNLLNKVFSDTSSAELEKVLMAATPYLTDTVMLATLSRTDTLTSEQIGEVFVPNSPLTTKVYNKLNTISLLTEIKNRIDSAQIGVSARDTLEKQIATISKQRSLAIAELTRIYMDDTTGNAISDMISFLDTQTDKDSKNLLVQAYLQNGQDTSAKTLLAQLPKQTTEDLNFYNLYNLLADLSIAGNTVFDLTSSQKQTIENIATSNTMVNSNARAILTMVDSVKYPEIIEELIVPNAYTLSGTLSANPLCGGSHIANDSIVLLDTTLMEVHIVKPALTDTAGKFLFNYNV